MITKTEKSKARMKADCTEIWGVGQTQPMMTHEAFEAVWVALPSTFTRDEWIAAGSKWVVPDHLRIATARGRG